MRLRHCFLILAHWAFCAVLGAAPALFIAGDSTAADMSHRPNSPQRGWGQAFSAYVLPPAQLQNRARAGRSTLSFRTEKLWDKLLVDLRPDDWVLIQFGHNDARADDPKASAPADGAYRDNLRRFIAEVRQRGAHPLLATSVAIRKWDETGAFVDSLADYVAAARAVATEEKVPVLDLHDLTVAMEKAAGVEGSKKFHIWPGKKDDVHFSEYGATRVAALAAAEIHRIKLPLAAWIKLPSEDAPAVPDSAPVAAPPAPAVSESAAPAAAPKGRAPTFADIAYGPEERQLLNVWKADSDKPTPVVIHMHGGAWSNGNRREHASAEVERYLAAGISYVSISYRFIRQARAARVMPPVEWPMHDAARAVQFVRSKSAEWHLDPARVAMTGESAGACTSLWIAFRDDLADPASADPVARQSTRLACVAVEGAQTTLDPAQMKEWTPNSNYGYHAFGFVAGGNYEARVAAFAQFVEQRESVLPWIRQYSPYELATPDDPPVYLYYTNNPGIGQPQKDPTHSANFGVKLKERLDAIGVPCELVYPRSGDKRHPTIADYLVEKLRAPAR